MGGTAIGSTLTMFFAYSVWMAFTFSALVAQLNEHFADFFGGHGISVR